MSIGIGNIADDPLFVDPDGPDGDVLAWEDNDYHLTVGSPCIDAGDDPGDVRPDTLPDEWRDAYEERAAIMLTFQPPPSSAGRRIA